MNIEQLRDFCLSLGGVEEKMPFGKFAKKFETTLVFYVSGHMFCLTDVGDPTFVEFRTSPESMAELLDRHEAVSRTINPAMKNWLHADFIGGMTDEEIFHYVREAYDIIKAKYAKKKKA